MDKKNSKSPKIDLSNIHKAEKISNGVSKDPPPNIEKLDVLPPPPPKPKKD